MRAIHLDEIKQELVFSYPGTGKDEKKIKAEILEDVFRTKSWTKLEKEDREFTSTVLKEGLEKMKANIDKRKMSNLSDKIITELSLIPADFKYRLLRDDSFISEDEEAQSKDIKIILDTLPAEAFDPKVGELLF